MDNTMIHQLVQGTYIPKMVKVRQIFDRPRIADIPSALREQLMRDPILRTIQPGMRIAVTAGSRGVANIAVILRELCAVVREQGAHPFLVPAMGSHGGATAEGQRAIIESYGITEEFCQAPILSSMEVVHLGDTEAGRPVYLDKNAAQADGIIPVGRIKPHTDFRGPCESGVIKMLVIGLGKQRGAEAFHTIGAKHMAENLLQYGRVILRKAPVLFGIGLLENAYDETYRIEVLEKDAIEDQEPRLLEDAKAHMGKILFDPIDLLIVDKIGKNISGEGMDPNVTGRFATPYASGGIHAEKCVVLDLTDESHGSIVGLGMADATTSRVMRKADFAASYANSMTSTLFLPSKIPLVFDSDKVAIQACLKYCGEHDPQAPRIVRLQDTLHLGEILVSQALAEEAAQNERIEILSQPHDLIFDEKGNLW